jgi:hypothetical protein
MTRRWWLPYGAWALLVGAGLLFSQSWMGYCAGLHPRMCANAFVADLGRDWDLNVVVTVVVTLAVGWTLIAAWRVLGRTTGVALAGWTILIAIPLLFIGRVQMCLGPLNVTPESCRAAMGLPPETDWERFANGPSPFIALLLAGWLSIAWLGTWLRRRQRGSL